VVKDLGFLGGLAVLGGLAIDPILVFASLGVLAV
jgi:hypothetical protein